MRGRRLLWAAAALAMAGLAATKSQRDFGSPQEAAQALVAAAENDDTVALLKIFGPEGHPIVDSGDRVADRKERMAFARMAQGKLQVWQDSVDRATLLVGPAGQTYPVPLVRIGSQWRFDSERGRAAVVARRVGDNEASAIEMCRSYVRAQTEYRQSHGGQAYAGKMEDLYSAGGARNPFPQPGTQTRSRKPMPRQGYSFRMLLAKTPGAPAVATTGGFALLAYPAAYGASGVRSFLVSEDAIVYAADLGPTTEAQVRKITQVHAEAPWKPLGLQ